MPPPTRLIEVLSFRVQFKRCHMLKSICSPPAPPPQTPTCFLSVSSHCCPLPFLVTGLLCCSLALDGKVLQVRDQTSQAPGDDFWNPHVHPVHIDRALLQPRTCWDLDFPTVSLSQPPSSRLGLSPPLPWGDHRSHLYSLPFMPGRASPPFRPLAPVPPTLLGRPSVLCYLQPQHPGYGFQWGVWPFLHRGPKAEVPQSPGPNLASHFPGHLASTPGK